jgi:hypothetical protein
MKIKRYIFFLINFFGIFFSIDALLIIEYWIFGFQINFSNKIQVFINMSGVFLIVVAPFISLINIFLFRNNTLSKVLGFTYLSLWICVLIRMALAFC